MNFKIDVDMTPEEFRKVMGLPDVASLQDEMISKIKEQMEAGVEGYDPLTLLKPYLTNSVGSVEAFQKMMLGMMSQYNSSSNDKK
ncbi:DUF6489 family protein [Neptunomonas phycophila]|jgi:hypothetical protein|uniref:DUF6489 family protein n=1 Tax=Neptunomonas phycophila TaxID=1572645 RepID=A0AAW7XDX9_9GAMM|nr:MULTISPECIES: DUF6489 family protein [Neptunomonas]MBT3145971.1 hypothetical protein [Neptunomonas phycophila]MDN2659877.1 DUF6489 family protein [Neptunomonas sp. CHC150]MDO6452399.1 DUF6489 family protein [Neptunomonas phycophila]MDO6467003.1 DUF6489 family protein [Neptunomonas phycophila]MDO6783358.1 DUF6489 family protein [Neptunomonas phycophila]